MNIQMNKVDQAFDPAAAVITKYKTAGWEALRMPPSNSVVDIIARKDEVKNKTIKTRFHFVQVMTPETTNDIKFRGEPRNNFVQNAFSNSAEPIVAMVTRTRTKAPEGSETKWTQKIKIVFHNVNNETTVRV